MRATKGQDVILDLSAMIVTVADHEPQVMVLPGRALPSGPFGTQHRTLEQALRAWVEAQSGLKLGYVEQLYTFADKDRMADGKRMVSIGYLALVRMPGAMTEGAEQLQAAPWYDFFPWEDRRRGVPQPVTNAIMKGLGAWKAAAPDSAAARARESRIAINFPKDPRAWNEELVLQRYELLWEAGLIEESHREKNKPLSPDNEVALSPIKNMPLSPMRGRGSKSLDLRSKSLAFAGEGGTPRNNAILPGFSMPHDHRRILATGIARLRAKIKYRPVVFELMPPHFTLLQLQNTVEALAGLCLHKQNFRRLIQTQGLVEETGGYTSDMRGRPAKLFAFRREVLSERAAAGTKLPRGG